MTATIRIASIEDVSKIISLQNAFLLSSLQKSFSDEEIERMGFFVYGLKKEEFLQILKGEENFLYVCENNGRIDGYAVACDFSTWLSGEKNWLETFQCSEEMKKTLVSRKVLYLKYICRRAGNSGVGQTLFDFTSLQAKKSGFEYVLDEVCEKPIENKASKNFQAKNGLREIGLEVDENGFHWRFYLKELQNE